MVSLLTPRLIVEDYVSGDSNQSLSDELIKAGYDLEDIEGKLHSLKYSPLTKMDFSMETPYPGNIYLKMRYRI